MSDLRHGTTPPGDANRSLLHARRPIFVRRWNAYWVWSFHRCDVCLWRLNLGRIGIGQYRRGF